MPHRLFVPKHKSRSPILSVSALLAANILMLILICARLTSLNYKDFHVLGFATDINTTQLLDKTNLERQKNSLHTLNYSQVLSNAARIKAEDMFNDDYWSHIAPDGASPWDFILGQGYKYSYAGENLAKDFNSSNSVVKAWMDSPTHRDNMLNSNYTEVGFAVVNGTLSGKETTLVVQMFGKPIKQSVVEKPETIEQVEIAQVDLAEVSTQEEIDLLSKSDSEDLIVLDSNPVVISNEAINDFSNSKDQDLITINRSYVIYFGYFMLFIFTISLVLDGFLAYQRGHLRVTGNTATHLLFFISSIIFLILLTSPDIL
jgi:hypothetical protein